MLFFQSGPGDRQALLFLYILKLDTGCVKNLKFNVTIQPPGHTRGARAAQALAPRERLRCAKTQRGDKYKLNNGAIIKNNYIVLVPARHVAGGSWCLGAFVARYQLRCVQIKR